MSKVVDVRDNIKKYEALKSKAESLGYIEANATLSNISEKAFCLDFGKAGIGEVWVPKSVAVVFTLGVSKGYAFFIPKWFMAKVQKNG